MSELADGDSRLLQYLIDQKVLHALTDQESGLDQFGLLAATKLDPDSLSTSLQRLLLSSAIRADGRYPELRYRKAKP